MRKELLVAGLSCALIGGPAQAAVEYVDIFDTDVTAWTRMSSSGVLGDNQEIRQATDFAPFSETVAASSECPHGASATSNAQMSLVAEETGFQLSGSISGSIAEVDQCSGWATAASGTWGNNSYIAFRVSEATDVYVSGFLRLSWTGDLAPDTLFRSEVTLEEGSARVLVFEERGDGFFGDTISLKPGVTYYLRAFSRQMYNRANNTFEGGFEVMIEFPETIEPATIIFINGLWNGPETALANFKSLEEALELEPATAGDYDRLRFKQAYAGCDAVLEEILGNNCFGDLVEAVAQLGAEDVIKQALRWLAGLDATPEAVRDLLRDAMASIDVEALLGNSDLNDHLELISNELKQGRRVIIVAHSQGNLFANAEYNRICPESARSSLGIVAVGTPDGPAAGGGPRITLEQDGIIDGVPGALGPNVDNMMTELEVLRSLFGHGFVDAYLWGGNYDGRARIAEAVAGLVASLPVPGDPDAITICTGAP